MVIMIGLQTFDRGIGEQCHVSTITGGQFPAVKLFKLRVGNKLPGMSLSKPVRSLLVIVVIGEPRQVFGRHTRLAAIVDPVHNSGHAGRVGIGANRKELPVEMAEQPDCGWLWGLDFC